MACWHASCRNHRRIPPSPYHQTPADSPGGTPAPRSFCPHVPHLLNSQPWLSFLILLSTRLATRAARMDPRALARPAVAQRSSTMPVATTANTAPPAPAPLAAVLPGSPAVPTRVAVLLVPVRWP
ncbi:uncharacterized protein L203_102361 [Cryptococcus depauperatus CBS 7841]|uniref:Uncharacterized protein n=1 Tax=Cryptococcus depauperatus CBS 7841 TaxID=1295531 RepID=A0AAJ8JRR4_9TREE